MSDRYRAFRTTRDYKNLQKALPGWYRIRNTAAGLPTQVNIYEEIGFLGVSADTFMRDLAGIDGDIEMHINSPGGDVFDGIAIYSQLRQRAGSLSVIVDGIAASAASFIAQAASPGKLGIAPHAAMMIHEGFAMCIGSAGDMRKLADDLEKASDNIAGIYADRAGKPASYWRDLMKNETWLYDDEAVAEGLADYVLGREQPQNSWDLSVYLHPPRNADGNHAPMTGTHSHSHADGRGGDHTHEHSHDGDAAHTEHEHYDPDNDGDDDSTAAGDTDHDYAGAANLTYTRFLNEKYNADDRKRMAGNGQAMPDGSYPIADEEDLGNAIRAVGRGGADHDAIRRHVIKRAKALGLSERIPDNWNADGSLKTSADNLAEQEFLAIVAGELDQLAAGKE